MNNKSYLKVFRIIIQLAFVLLVIFITLNHNLADWGYQPIIEG